MMALMSTVVGRRWKVHCELMWPRNGQVSNRDIKEWLFLLVSKLTFLGGNLLAPKFDTHTYWPYWLKIDWRNLSWRHFDRRACERSCVEVILAKKEKTLREFSKLKTVSTEKLLYQQQVDLNLKKGGKGSSFGIWEKRRGVKMGVKEHAEDTCPHPEMKQLFDNYLLLV